MGQSKRQAARRAAIDTVSRARRNRAERESRIQDVAVEVLVALAERDQAISDCEARAAKALATIEREGLTMAEAVEWFAEKLTVREATRLRGCGEVTEKETAPVPPEAADDQSTVAATTGSGVATAAG